MGNRSQKILSIRENLNLPLDSNLNQELVNFQNTSLRPILKFQNDLLLKLFHIYIEDRKFKWATSDVKMKEQFVYKSLSTDKHFKTLLIGCIISLFTSAELEIYLKQQKEINRRITAMMKERIIDQLIEKVIS